MIFYCYSRRCVVISLPAIDVDSCSTMIHQFENNIQKILAFDNNVKRKTPCTATLNETSTNEYKRRRLKQLFDCRVTRVPFP